MRLDGSREVLIQVALYLDLLSSGVLFDGMDDIWFSSHLHAMSPAVFDLNDSEEM